MLDPEWLCSCAKLPRADIFIQIELCWQLSQIRSLFQPSQQYLSRLRKLSLQHFHDSIIMITTTTSTCTAIFHVNWAQVGWFPLGFLSPSVLEENLYRSVAEVFYRQDTIPVTQTNNVRALKETQSTDPNPKQKLSSSWDGRPLATIDTSWKLECRAPLVGGGLRPHLTQC